MRKDINLSLYLVTDRKLIGNKSLENVIIAAVKGGVSAVQLREKDCTTREFIEIARKIKNLLYNYNIPLIINDRLDVAMIVKADGVHLGQTDASYSDARSLMGYESIIGISVENMDQVYEAISTDVDYISISPLFLTPTKPEADKEWGIEGLQKVRKLTSKYIVAIGGINESNAESAIAAGADGLAVVSAICSSRDPEDAARKLRTIINQKKHKK